MRTDLHFGAVTAAAAAALKGTAKFEILFLPLLPSPSVDQSPIENRRRRRVVVVVLLPSSLLSMLLASFISPSFVVFQPCPTLQGVDGSTGPSPTILSYCH